MDFLLNYLDVDELVPDRVFVYERWVLCNNNEERLERIVGMFALGSESKYHQYRGFNKFTKEVFELPPREDGWKFSTELDRDDYDQTDSEISDDDVSGTDKKESFDEEKAKTDKIAYFKKYTLKTICDPSRNVFIPSQNKISDSYPSYTKYKTEDNGGIGYIVFIKDNKVFVYGREKDQLLTLEDDDLKPEYYFTRLVKEYDALEVFIGKSVENKMTKFSGGYGPKWDGNSILLRIGSTSEYKYAMIGICLTEFEIDEPITEFVSSVGNNCVPYPYAVSKNYVYCMSDFNRSNLSGHSDRYERGYISYKKNVEYNDIDHVVISERDIFTHDYEFPPEKNTNLVRFTKTTSVTIPSGTSQLGGCDQGNFCKLL